MSELAALKEATWPPAQTQSLGPWTLRQGAGGGQRVSAATVHGAWDEAAIDAAETGMRAMGQEPLFMVTPQDDALDQSLAARGYLLKDPVVLYLCRSADLCAEGPARMSTFPHWPPMAIARDLWAEGHIGPQRLAVMARALGPKTAILGRAHDRASGVAFVALSGDVAFVHALHVTPEQRRKGAAQNILRAAALWAQEQGATRVALAVTAANTGARALYAFLGLQVVGGYHYRQWPSGTPPR